MIRNALFASLGTAALLLSAGQGSAQIVVPKIPFPMIDGISPELQKELQQAFEQAAQPARQASGQLEWGGARMEKAPAEMQTDLGLGEKEGLVVAAVSPNSVGEKAGLKAKDVLIKFGGQPVPNDATSFGLLVKEHKADEPIDLVVVRDGKEETLKGTRMPAQVQNLSVNGVDFVPRIGIRPAIGFGPYRGPRELRIPNIPVQPGMVQNIHMELTVNGARIVRKQTNDQFSGEYSKDGLTITINGKVENGQSKPAEITVTEGKETKKYTSLRDVPERHRLVIQQLMPSARNGIMLMPLPLNLPELRLVPLVPGLQR